MTVEIRNDREASILAGVRKLTHLELLVGVPGPKTEREDDAEKQTVTNAMLARTHEMGDPARNIPERPFLVPGIKNARDKIVAKYKAAGLAAVEGREQDAEMAIDEAGVIAERAVRKKITDGPFVPIKEQTKRARLERTQTYKNASEKRKKTMMEKFLAGDFKPLLDTGQLRQSITHVVRRKGQD